MSETAHTALKKYLTELGKTVKDSKGKPYYDSCGSGDSEPLDIRSGKRHLEYYPDVIWERGGKHFLIELSFTDDWRAIVGELTLASMSKGLGGIIIVTANTKDGWDADSISNLVSLISGELDIEAHWINLAQEDIDDFEKGKKALREWLKKWGWI
ncbi:MAG TPA: hypothetical protein VK536_02805 [Candidatus Limnocylindrales bacterium]|nr:hypothetical protein [Candidatus Limnocylindrales bacterium]